MNEGKEDLHQILREVAMTMPGVRLEAHRDRTVRMATFMAGTFNVSNMVCVMRSRWEGASLSKTGCSSGAIMSSG